MKNLPSYTARNAQKFGFSKTFLNHCSNLNINCVFVQNCNKVIFPRQAKRLLRPELFH